MIESTGPHESSEEFDLSNQQKVPRTILQTAAIRAWMGGLIQGEGCIESHYVKASDSTTIDVVVAMTDPAPIFQFADYVGTSRPTKAKQRKHGYKPIWIKSVAGLRGYRLLQEVLPFLEGEKHREAEKALTFFDVHGYHRGHFLPIDIWPPDEFPLRRRTKYFPPKSI
jgi:hypothetical protein